MKLVSVGRLNQLLLREISPWLCHYQNWHSSRGGGSSGGNTTGALQVRNTLPIGVFAVPGFTWNVQPNLRSIADLPIGTQMMACGPGNLYYMPIQADFEALQVARWALDCFVSAVPITHPGGRGNYGSVPASLAAEWVGSLGAGVGPYVFQTLRACIMQLELSPSLTPVAHQERFPWHYKTPHHPGMSQTINCFPSVFVSTRHWFKQVR